jgi:hypothetical protein
MAAMIPMEKILWLLLLLLLLMMLMIIANGD